MRVALGVISEMSAVNDWIAWVRTLASSSCKLANRAGIAAGLFSVPKVRAQAKRISRSPVFIKVIKFSKASANPLVSGERRAICPKESAASRRNIGSSSLSASISALTASSRSHLPKIYWAPL